LIGTVLPVVATELVSATLALLAEVLAETADTSCSGV